MNKDHNDKPTLTAEVNLAHQLALPGHLSDVFQLYMEPTGNPYLTYDPMGIGEFEKIYEDLLTTSTLFIVHKNENIVASYRLIPKTHRQSQTWYLGGFVVHHACKGEGIGYEVLKYIKKKGEENNIRRIELTVALENESAIGLYKKAGFEIEGIIKSSYRLNESLPYYDEYSMALII